MGKLLYTDLKMIFGTKKYYITLLGTILTAVVSLLFIRLLARQYMFFPSEVMAALGNADSLNLYVVKVKEIEDLVNLNGADMMYLCFSGCVLPGVIAVFCVQWIVYGYKTGMVRFVVARGYDRRQIVISKFISAFVGMMGIILVYVLVSVIGGALSAGLGEINLIRFLPFYVSELMIHAVFGFLCMGVAYVIESEVMAIVCMISLIVAVPDLLKYLQIFMNSSKSYEGLWLLNYASKLALEGNCNMKICACYLVTAVAASVMAGIVAFSGKEIR